MKNLTKRIVFYSILTGLTVAGCALLGLNPKPAPDFDVPDKDFAHTKIAPTLHSPVVEGENIAWCKISQICWDKVMQLNGGPVQAPDSLKVVAELNNPPFKSKAGEFTSCFVGPATADNKKKAIEKAREMKLYPGQVEQMVSGYSQSDMLIFGTYWLTDLFEHAFTATTMDFMDKKVAGFTINGNHEIGDEQRKQVLVHWYDDPENEIRALRMQQIRMLSGQKYDIEKTDPKAEQKNKEIDAKIKALEGKGKQFIVELLTKSRKRRIILACIDEGKTLADNVKIVQQKLALNKPEKMQNTGDYLYVPEIAFKKSLKLDFAKELGIKSGEAGKELFAKEMFIAMKFKLDRKGVELRTLVVCQTLCIPKIMDFNKPFFVMIFSPDSTEPDFVAYISNPEGMQAK